MLRIIQNSHAAGAKSYYTSGDYYLDGEEQELPGVWRGEGAKKLGLTGEIQRADWDALCDGINPTNGEKLLQRRKDNRTVCYDFNFHVPKSISLLYALTGDDRILDAFRDSVDSTMQDIEQEMHTRVRKDGKNEDRLSRNMTVGLFIHKTARPIDGVPDCHLHAHAVAFNCTHDDQEQAWKAGQFRPILNDAAWWGAVFHARFARRLSELGLPIERTKKSYELAGVSRALIEKFSRRTALIEERAREKGIEDPDAKAELGAKTRSKKVKNLSMPQLQAEWRGRMTPQELDAMSRLEKLLGGDAQPQDESAAGRGIAYAIGHEFERKSVIPERKLLTTALKHSIGHALPEQVVKEADRNGVIIGERCGRRMVTTREVLEEEKRIIDFARGGRGTLPALGKRGRKLKRDWLNEFQRAAVKHILESHDRVTLVRGAAGVGKTTLLKEAVEAIEENGTKVFPFAPTAQASRGVLQDEGFKDANTLATLFKDKRLQQRARGQLIWVDEAGLVDTKTMGQLFDLAEKLDTRILLTGDRKQHHSVARGDMLRLLEEEAGCTPADVAEIKRQSGDYKLAVKALSEGRTAEGFNRLDKLGWIREAPEDERYKLLADDYVNTVTDGKTCLVVAPTHAEGDRTTARIRETLKSLKKLGKQEHTFRVMQNANLTEAERGDALNYLPGDVLQFHQNAKGYKRGDRVEVADAPLPLDQANRFTVFRTRSLSLAKGDWIRITHNGYAADGYHRLNNGALYRIEKFDKRGNIVLENGWKITKDFGHLAHGYVVTSHASQGRTVKRVLIAQSSMSFPASSREQFYVSCSRGSEGVTVYCDDKKALKEAVAQSEERLTATDLMKEKAREVVELHRRQAEFHPEPQRERQRELVHER
jgi:conjugative relaxase-like TrwC/TraI family protein